jgi:hypothetical protein
VSEEERKRTQEVAEWLNTDEGYHWARANFSQVSYGRNRYLWYSPFFQFKDLDTDVSGSSADFCVNMAWGRLPGDDKLLEEFVRQGGDPWGLV